MHLRSAGTTATLLLLSGMAQPGFADEPSCLARSVEDQAAASYAGFPEGQEFSQRPSMFPFRGTLAGLRWCDWPAPRGPELCALDFDVGDAPFELMIWFAGSLGLPVDAPTRRVQVSASRFPAELGPLEVGTEWLVVVSNFGATDGSGLGRAPLCGDWLGRIRDGDVYFDPTGAGDRSRIVHRPWSVIRERILAPVRAVPEGERRRVAERMAASAMERTAARQREDATRRAPEVPVRSRSDGIDSPAPAR